MVGDGANDAAAIRAASVGIGVAAEGSDPARTAADVMLLDGRIEALIDAIDEGHDLWRRVQSAVSVLLGGNAGEVCFALISSVLTGRSVLNARQMLLVNMLTDALPAAALAVSPQTETGAGRPRRGRDVAGDRYPRSSDHRRGHHGVAARAGDRYPTARRHRRVDRPGFHPVAADPGRLARSTGGDHDTRHIRCDGRGDQHARGEPVIRLHARGPVGWGEAASAAGAATSLGPCPPTATRAYCLRQVQSSTMTTTPARTRTAYRSHSGGVSTRTAPPSNASCPRPPRRFPMTPQGRPRARRNGKGHATGGPTKSDEQVSESGTHSDIARRCVRRTGSRCSCPSSAASRSPGPINWPSTARSPHWWRSNWSTGRSRWRSASGTR